MANKTITQLDAAQSLNDNMVIAVQDTNTTYKTTLADIKAYCGIAPSGDKYKVGDRVNDDSNNPVGTVVGFKTNSQGVNHAVVCLDGTYRAGGKQYQSIGYAITNLPQYSNQTVWGEDNSATENTDLILAYVDSHTETSSACSHCRQYSFLINGVNYAGQLPTIGELVDIFKMRTTINSLDPSSSQDPIPTNVNTWSSTQCGSAHAWYAVSDGTTNHNVKNSSYFVIPVLEIPLD